MRDLKSLNFIKMHSSLRKTTKQLLRNSRVGTIGSLERRLAPGSPFLPFVGGQARNQSTSRRFFGNGLVSVFRKRLASGLLTLLLIRCFHPQGKTFKLKKILAVYNVSCYITVAEIVTTDWVPDRKTQFVTSLGKIQRTARILYSPRG